MILGIDEAGRGPWAGPLVVGAVVLGGRVIDGLTDSKKLTKKKRELLYEEIIGNASAFATGWVSANDIDKLGLSEALKLATKRAVEQITVQYSEIIIDGTINFLAGTGKGRYVQTMAKADLLVPSVSAASIIAKVERDRYMLALDEVYPGYGFGSHAGYGVARHREAIGRLGVTSEHRLSFAPLSKYSPVPPLQALKRSTSTESPGATRSATTREIGDGGESAAAEYLQRSGHIILERNWRTKLCEIDIVSQKGSTVYLVEVKHRKNDTAGDGFAAITAKKLRQMQFAAELYAHIHRLHKADLRLAVVATSGTPPEVVDYTEIL